MHSTASVTGKSNFALLLLAMDIRYYGRTIPLV